ncbi:hypothetical protein R1sor_004031 [Riccia sorocarpa]|uniref:Aldehyde dehydrogenase domain-containing protein n=1 Tax=Riccia sorocarpa TaxID=122646 RepID=A0ABD3H652_9MARC
MAVAKVPSRQLFIGGEWVAPARGGKIPCPTTEEQIGQIPAATAEDVDAAVKAARQAFTRNNGKDWSRASGKHRAKILRAIAAKVVERKKELAVLETLDCCKPIEESEWDMDDVSGYFDYYANLAEKLNEKQYSPIEVPMEQFKSSVLREALGVIGLITPWNYPRRGSPPGVLNIITGLGPEAGAPLSYHPDVDKVSFTGSYNTARTIMKAAAETVKPVTLELGGGHCACVPQEAGCLASSIKISNPLEKDCRLGPLVNDTQYQKVKDFVKEAEDEGATLLCGGKRPPHLEKSYFLELMVLTDVTPSMRIWKEEVFGPVLTVTLFKTEEEAITLANDTQYGLGGAIISKEEGRCKRVAELLDAGIVWINCSQPCFCQAPWGGKKRSGFGRELGEWGLENYLSVKQITRYVSDDPFGWYPASKL